MDKLKQCQRTYDAMIPDDEDGPCPEDIAHNAERDLERRIDAADYARER